MKEALDLIQKKLDEYKALYTKANDRVNVAKDQAELARQERDVYSSAIDELNQSLKVLSRVQQEEISAQGKANSK